MHIAFRYFSPNKICSNLDLEAMRLTAKGGIIRLTVTFMPKPIYGYLVSVQHASNAQAMFDWIKGYEKPRRNNLPLETYPIIIFQDEVLGFEIVENN